jgi:hypothetical protein
MVHVEFADGLSRKEYNECSEREARSSEDGVRCNMCGRCFIGLPLMAVYDDRNVAVEHFRGCPHCMTDEYLMDMYDGDGDIDLYDGVIDDGRTDRNGIPDGFRTVVNRAIKMDLVRRATAEDLWAGRCCSRCNTWVFKELDRTLGVDPDDPDDVPYPYYCPNCDENMMAFETYEYKVPRKGLKGLFKKG